jgi:hypothetical protein
VFCAQCVDRESGRMREVTYREDLLCRETARLIALGVVQESRLETPTTPWRGLLKSTTGPLHPHPRRGRKRIHASGYLRLKAHRKRKSGIRIKGTDDNEIGL